MKAWRSGVPGLLLTSLVACGGGDAELGDAIAEAVGRGDGAPLDLRELTGFSWERMHVFAPYTTMQQVQAELGFEWSGARHVGIHERDDIALLVFVSQRKVSGCVAHPRNRGDFAGAARNGGFARERSLFRVRLDGEWAHLVPAGAAEDER